MTLPGKGDTPAAGWQAPRCECGHTEGDHRCVVTPRRAIVGVCLMAGCGCPKFSAADSAVTAGGPR